MEEGPIKNIAMCVQGVCVCVVGWVYGSGGGGMGGGDLRPPSPVICIKSHEL